MIFIQIFCVLTSTKNTRIKKRRLTPIDNFVCSNLSINPHAHPHKITLFQIFKKLDFGRSQNLSVDYTIISGHSYFSKYLFLFLNLSFIVPNRVKKQATTCLSIPSKSQLPAFSNKFFLGPHKYSNIRKRDIR